MILNKEQIKNLIEEKNLIENFINLEIQLQPNGFDLTAGEIYKIKNSGRIDFSNSERIISETDKILPEKNIKDKYGWWNLKKGVYKIKTNEILNLPNNLAGIAFTRTSLLRCGCFISNGIWDAGFKGKSEFLLYVSEYGIKIKENARVNQIMFLRLEKETENYNGIFKNLS
ncbi:MAG: deoxyuridine 5'-triphosphate nucleotidohydrolase [Candidatus Aenigmarchaeota archaeon ex4484_56]|nr:MAG: deoxyuridine 5'-triphosphate nucleotidohydrolase [Candidatus Aenigmarchaeota archaeon ex4484_56]